MRYSKIERSPSHKGIDRAALSMLAAVLVFTSAAMAQTESVLYSFTGQNGDGGIPSGYLVADAAGNLYGTTFAGGSFNGKVCAFAGCGTVYELSPALGGGYTESVIYAFSGGSDGSEPAAGLVIDAAGNLFGTTAYGGSTAGADCNTGGNGCGVVFELSPESGGGWTEQVLYTDKLWYIHTCNLLANCPDLK
jgi:hypothetical protein